MKKLRKIKFELIKMNLHQYTNDKQKLEGDLNLGDYFGKMKKNEKNEIKTEDSSSNTKKISPQIDSLPTPSNESENFLDIISNSSNFQSKSKNVKSNKDKVSKTNTSDINLSQLNHFEKFKYFPSKNLIGINTINIGHYTFINLNEPYNDTSIRLNLNMKYNLEKKNLFWFPRVSVGTPIRKYLKGPTSGFPNNFDFLNFSKNPNLRPLLPYLPIYNKTKFDSMKKSIKSTFYFSEVEKLPFLQRPYIRSFYRYNKENNKFNFSFGNKYKDEAIRVKTSFTLPQKIFKVYFHTYLKDAYNSIIGFKIKNLKKLIFFYKGYLLTDLEIFSKLKINLNKSVKFIFFSLYNISKKFKLGVWNSLKIHSLKETSNLYNVISLGLHFKSFDIRIPIVISRIENSADLSDIFLANLIINGIVYSIHIFKKILF
jgi:hypothetical protein